MKTRSRTTTEKVPTPFGNLYAHVDHDEDGTVHAVYFSSPGKFSETAVGDALILLGTAVTGIVRAVRGHEGSE